MRGVRCAYSVIDVCVSVMRDARIECDLLSFHRHVPAFHAPYIYIPLGRVVAVCCICTQFVAYVEVSIGMCRNLVLERAPLGEGESRKASSSE